MKKIISITLLIFYLLLPNNSEANHIAGADLSYVCLGNDQYQVNLNVFVDCVAGVVLNSQQTVRFSSTCGNIATTIVNVINASGTEISQLCPSKINNSICNGGSLPGMKVFHYSGVVTLATPCDTWTMYWGSCCRNAAILNLQTPGNNGTYVEATLHSVTALCNNSPSFTAQPIPYVCVNQLVNYNFEVTEIDGDSLYYSLIDARAVGPTTLAYTAGYSAATAIPGIVIDHNAGQLTFTPTTIGSFVVVVLIQEYDKNGKLIGSVMRDIQFVVQSCSNNIPDASGGIISIVSGADKTSSYSVETCEGSTFTFNATYTDVDAGDTLTLLSDIASVLPGSTVITKGENPLVATMSWTAPAGSVNATYIFKVTVGDGSCPVPGQQLFTYTLKMIPPCDTSAIFIPNVFTPGGTHPLFLVNTKNLVSYNIQIFDRWGKKIFESSDVNSPWDGKNVMDGTYYYLIEAKGVDKKEYNKKGFLQRIGMH